MTMVRRQSRAATESVAATNSRPVQLPGPVRRGQILDAARQAFMSSGLAGARVRTIADIAGCNEALIYHYFDSKEHLFEVAILEPLQEMMGGFAEAAGKIGAEPLEDPDVEKRIRETAVQLIRTMNQTMPLLGIALFGDDKQGERFYTEDFYPLLAKGAELAFQAYSKPLDPSLLAAVFGMAFGIAMDHWFRKVDPDEDQLADVLTQFVLKVMVPAMEQSPARPTRAVSKRPARKRSQG